MPSSSSSRVVRECLSALGEVNFEGCDDLESEFKAVKRAYFKKVLSTHPDKGGDASEFREVNASFEVLREMFNNATIDSFTDSKTLGKSTNYEWIFSDLKDIPTPSWEFYSQASSEDVPPYRVELAKSNRSTCKVCKNKIDAGQLRFGSMLQETGTYTRWHHLDCWRVPGRVWLGLLRYPPPPQEEGENAFLEGKVAKAALLRMESILISGLSELPTDQHLEEVLAHCLDLSFHARLTKKTVSKARADKAKTSETLRIEDEHQQHSSSRQRGGGAVVVSSSKPKFVVPKPGKGGAVANSLSGKTIVITGTFPELGGGAGLMLGKERCKSMIEKFGGRVTSAISGKTDVLVVGKDPGFSKVSKARSNPAIKLIGLGELNNVIHGLSIEDTESVKISSFSSGYAGNSLAYKASETELAIACGVGPTMLPEDAPETTKKKKPTARKPAAKVKRQEADLVEKTTKAPRKRAAPSPPKADDQATEGEKSEKKKKAPRRTKEESTKEGESDAPDSRATDIVVARSRSGRATRIPPKYT